MAKYTVEHKCGHKEEHALSGKSKEREWRLERLASELCSECEEQLRLERIENKKIEAEKQGFIALQGTQKQIGWAVEIREAFVKRIQNLKAKALSKKDYHYVIEHNIEVLREAEYIIPDEAFNVEYVVKKADCLIEYIKHQPSASWFIDRRNIGEIFVDEVLTFILSNLNILGESAATTELLIPENKVSDMIVRIKDETNVISVKFDKKQEVIDLVKQLGYRWDGTEWRLELNDRLGMPEDRVAEIGNLLLAKGYKVNIKSADARAKAIAGNYEPVHFRWIVGKKDDNYLYIYFEKNQGLYEAARSLPYTKYNSGAVLVKPDYHAAIEDFASRYGFKFNMYADEAIASAKRAHEQASVVSPANVKKHFIVEGDPDTSDLRDD